MSKDSTTAKFFMSFGLVMSVLLGVLVDNILYVPPVPKIRDTWWGPDNGSTQADTEICPFRLNVSQSVLDDLKHRIERTRIAKPLQNTKQEYGIHPALVYNVSRYLINDYNWQERQERINEFPQYITNIQGLQIHYIQVKPRVFNENVKVLPLLMLHGFPSSMIEFISIIPSLTERYGDDEIIFELIIPNIPGFGLSDGTTKSGLGCADLAVIMKNLMHRIGHRHYYVFGTDWGSVIASNMGILYPGDVLGIYSPMCISMLPKSFLKFILWELYPFKQVYELYRRPYNSISMVILEMMRDLGYMHQFGSQPDSIGISLNDSPIGLLAQILNLFWKGTDCRFVSLDDGGMSNFNLDIILDNFMIHWIGGQIYSTTRLYAESLSIDGFFKLSLIPVDPTVPVSCPQLPGEIVYFPDWILKDKYPNLVRSTMFRNGGHFYNYERLATTATNNMMAGKRGNGRLSRHEMAADIFQSVVEMRLQRS